jgi:cobalt-zinc-cadmium efflux system outer membrane protein
MLVTGYVLAFTALPLQALHLEEALAKALDAAPILEASSARIESREQLIRQAGRWTNPTLSIEAENFGGTDSFSGNDAAEYTIALEQPIELGGKRKARKEIAEKDLEESKLRAEVALGELKAEVRRRFVRCLQAREQLQQAAELERAARAAADAVEVQKEVGGAAGLDDRRTRVALALASIEVEGAERNYHEAMEMLAALWDGGTDFDVEGELTIPRNLPEDGLYADLLQSSARWQLAVFPSEMQKRALELERAAAWPDLSIGLGHRRFEENDAGAWVAGLSISLPLFDRNLGAIEAAASRVRQTAAEVKADQRRLRESLRMTVSAVRRAHDTADRLREEALPLARETYGLVAEGYGLGRYELLYLLEARKTLTEVERHWIEAQAQFHLALADLQSLVGKIPASLQF